MSPPSPPSPPLPPGSPGLPVSPSSPLPPTLRNVSAEPFENVEVRSEIAGPGAPFLAARFLPAKQLTSSAVIVRCDAPPWALMKISAPSIPVSAVISRPAFASSFEPAAKLSVPQWISILGLTPGNDASGCSSLTFPSMRMRETRGRFAEQSNPARVIGPFRALHRTSVESSALAFTATQQENPTSNAIRLAASDKEPSA
jgi:hypothetical protein